MSKQINCNLNTEASTNKAEPLDLILLELQALREQVSQQTLKIASLEGVVNSLTCEVVAARNELREIKKINIPVELESISKQLPFSSLEDIDKFELDINGSNDKAEDFIRVIKRVGGGDVVSFTRNAIKRVVTDDLALQFSWKGTRTKRNVGNMYFITLIRDACQQKFNAADESQIHHVLQQHFAHAADRVAKRKDQMKANKK